MEDALHLKLLSGPEWQFFCAFRRPLSQTTTSLTAPTTSAFSLKRGHMMLRATFCRKRHCPSTRLGMVRSPCQPVGSAGCVCFALAEGRQGCDAALHDLDSVFRKFTRSSKMAQLLVDLGQSKPMPVQSMYIFKVRPDLLCTLQFVRRRLLQYKMQTII